MLDVVRLDGWQQLPHLLEHTLAQPRLKRVVVLPAVVDARAAALRPVLDARRREGDEHVLARVTILPRWVLCGGAGDEEQQRVCVGVGEGGGQRRVALMLPGQCQ